MHYLYLRAEGSARKAAESLASAGYECTVRPAAKGPDWLVLAKIMAVPTDEVIEGARRDFEVLASRFGGEYDGWEAGVTR